MAFPSVTYTFANSTTADATQVNQNFSDIINGLTDGTKDLSVNNIAGAGSLAASGAVTLGASSSNLLTINCSLNSSIAINTNTSFDIGSATKGIKSIYFGGGGSNTLRILMPVLGATWTLTPPTNVPALTSLLQSDTSGTLTYKDPSSFETPRNFLINSGFDIWQRGTAITAIANASSTYGPDRWYAKNSLGTNGVLRIDQETGITNGSSFGCQVKISTAPTAAQTNGCELYQTLENLDSMQLYGQTASFTVLVKALQNVNQIGVQFFYKTSEAKVDTSVGSEVLTTVNSSTFVACTITAQALGTSMTTSGALGIRIRITGVSSGNTYDINNGFVVEQAQLNLGNVAATWRRAGASFAHEAALCQRYFEKSYDLISVGGVNTTNGITFCAVNAVSSNGTVFIPFKVTKRSNPTMAGWTSGGSAGQWTSISSGNTPTARTVAFSGTGTSGTSATLTSSGTDVVAQGHWTADADI